MRRTVKSLGALTLALALVLAFFRETVFQGRSLVPTDIVHELILPFCAGKDASSVRNHYAVDAVITDIGWERFWRDSVLRGQLPLWNPEVLGGQAAQAESWTATFNPTRLVFLALPLERAFSLRIVLELGMATAFMLAFLRELGLSRWGALLGAVAWGLNSQFLMWYWRAPGALCWAPLVLLLAERSLSAVSLRCAFGAGLVLGVAFLSGSVQACAHLGFLCAAWFAGGLLWPGASTRRRVLAHGVLVFAVATLVSAVQWLPTLEMMRLDAWGSAGARGPMAGWRRLAQIPALVSFVLPSASGSTESYDLLKVVGASRMDFQGSIGVLGFALACVGGIACRDRRAVKVFLGLGCAVVVLVLFTPLVKYLYHRFFVVYVFAASALAGYGLDALRSGGRAAERAGRLVFQWLLVGSLVAFLALLAIQGAIHSRRAHLENTMWARIEASGHSAAYPHRPDWLRARVGRFLDHYRASNPSFAIPLACSLLAAGAWFVASRRRSLGPMLAPAFVLLNAVDLLGTGRELVPQVDLARYPLAPAHPAVTRMDDGKGGRVARLGPHGIWILRPNLLMSHGLADAQGNFSLAPDNLLRGFEGEKGPSGAFTDLASVRYLVAERGFTPRNASWQPCWDGDGIRIYRNPTCLPRLQFVTRYRVIPDRAETWQFLKGESFDPRSTVALQKEPSWRPIAEGVDRGKAGHPPVLRMLEDGPLRVYAELDLPARGLVVLADTFHPGWKAVLDGKEVEVLLADACLRAVAVGPGKHTLAFEFQPRSFRNGLRLTLFGLILAAGGMVCLPGSRACGKGLGTARREENGRVEARTASARQGDSGK
jgi:hypothetical protein